MDWTEVRRLVKLVEKSGIHELELEREGTRIRLVKSESTAEVVPTIATQQIPVQQAPAPAVQPAPAPAPAPAAETAADVDTGKNDYHEVKSPMVGTFYAAPAPDADPYVKVGDHVEVGQTLCIVEAMKLMNEIEADVAGRIVEILCQNETPVEFGSTLFLIDPKG